jgi:hypothetical protein
LVATKDPKTGEMKLVPAGTKFRIDAAGNIREIRSKDDPLGIRTEPSEVPQRKPGETISEYLKRTGK